jgi:hypothetical protein
LNKNIICVREKTVINQSYRLHRKGRYQLLFDFLFCRQHDSTKEKKYYIHDEIVMSIYYILFVDMDAERR